MSSDEYIKWGDVKVDLGNYQIPEEIVGLLKEIVTEVLIGCQFVYVVYLDYSSQSLKAGLKVNAFCTPSNADIEIMIDWYVGSENQSNICGINFSIHDRRRGMYVNSKPAFSGARAIELNGKYKE